MDKVVPGIIVIVVLAALLALMWFAWRRRNRRDAGIQPGYPLPAAGPGPATVAATDAFYVASTRRDKPLERLNIPGLGFRARAHLAVRADGLVLALAGEEPRFIPATAIEVVGLATWAIDRVVERDGLVLVGWHAAGQTTDAPGTGVDSYFRIVDTGDRDRIIQALTHIAPATVKPAGTTESEA